MSLRPNMSLCPNNVFENKTFFILNTTRNFSRLRRLSFLLIRTKGQSNNKNDVISKTFLFMGNMSPYYFKTIYRLCVECIPSFIKIGGAVSEKNGRIGQTFVVLYIGCILNGNPNSLKAKVNNDCVLHT